METTPTKIQTLHARLIELNAKTTRVQQISEDIQRNLLAYGEKGVTNTSLESLDSAILGIESIRNEIRNVLGE